MIDVDFTVDDFAKMRYNPLLLGKSSSLKKWEDLTKFPEMTKKWADNYNKDRYLQFCMFMYDKDSPFVKYYGDDVHQRRMQCALKAGYRLNESSGQFKEVDAAAITGEYQPAAAMAVRVMRILRGLEWTLYNVLLEKAYDETVNFRANKEGSSVSKIKEVINEKEKISIALRANESAPGVLAELYRQQQLESLKLRPEEIAEMLENGGSLDYPEG